MTQTKQATASRKKKKNIGQICLHVFFILLSLCYILPFILVVSASLTSEQEIIAGGFSLLPREFSAAAYKLAFRDMEQVLNSYKTTFIFSSVGTILSMLVSAMMAYAMSRSNFKLNGIITFLVFFTMLFSGGRVPSYIINTKYLHLGNTIWIYILPGVVSAWNIIVLRTNYKQIPTSLFESAKIDGASETRICFQIAMPLTVPAIAAIGFMSFVNRWNNWVTSSIYIRDPDLYSLQYLLQKILNEIQFLQAQMNSAGGASWMIQEQLTNLPTESYRFAMAIIAAGPVLVVFPFFQKYFTKGMTIGAVKG